MNINLHLLFCYLVHDFINKVKLVYKFRDEYVMPKHAGQSDV